MASDSAIIRSFSRLRRFIGVRGSNDVPTNEEPTQPTVHYGMYAEGELRHIAGIGQQQIGAQNRTFNEQTIAQFLSEIASNTRKKIDEIKNLKLMSPEIEQAALIIVSTIISPTDMQTDKVPVQVSDPNLSTATNTKISDYLTKYFNDTFHLGSKLYQWYKTAGFEEGAQAILILPKHEIDVLNTVADKWSPQEVDEWKKIKERITTGTEALAPTDLKHQKEIDKIKASVEAIAMIQLEKTGVWQIAPSTESKDAKSTSDKKKDGEQTELQRISKNLVDNSFKLLQQTDDGNGVVVTRDFNFIGKQQRKTEARITELEREAERQVHGFSASNPDGGKPAFPVLCLSDVVKTGKEDLPIVMELPSDAVIPVCAPRDNKNHIGYFILLDENGQPLKGQYAFTGAVNSDVVNRMATNAAKALFGTAEVNAYINAGLTETQAIDQMTQIFGVAVNHLLESKLNQDGLTGLDVNVHGAVGKALFYHLLAKNKIKMIFIPANLMIYFRFDHRQDGTGKTLIEDIAFVLGLRTTFNIAKIMAAIENATQHRRIEVSIDEKEVNPLEFMELVRREYLSKKAPAWTTDPTTAAEAILNQHISIVPKDMQGTTNNLEVTTEKSYGNAQAPDDTINDNLNNWVCMGLGVPAAALNQLSEAEYSRSVATQNLIFANKARLWQGIVEPENTKFLQQYILCNHPLQETIMEFIRKDTEKTGDNKADENKGKDAGDQTAPSNVETDTKATEELKNVIATIKIALPPPMVSTSKAHFEEIGAQIDAIQRMLETVFPDDIAPSDDLRSLMVSVRAVVASRILREYLPKLGFHEVAHLPQPDEISTDVSARMILLLQQFKRRAEGLAKLTAGDLNTPPAGGGGGSEGGDDSGGGEWG